MVSNFEMNKFYGGLLATMLSNDGNNLYMTSELHNTDDF